MSRANRTSAFLKLQWIMVYDCGTPTPKPKISTVILALLLLIAVVGVEVKNTWNGKNLSSPSVQINN